METKTCPKTWMLESILVTLFCCLPFGIIGIVNASKVSSQFAAGNVDAANAASQSAGKWVKIGAGIGLVAILIYVIAVYILGSSLD